MTTYIPKATMLSPSNVAYTLDANRPVLTHGRSMLVESGIAPHAHPRGQLLWAASGVLRVTSEQAIWVVPSTYAMWIPGGVYHQVNSETSAKIRNIYIDPSYPVRAHEKSVVMLAMSPLMREIMLRLTEECTTSINEAKQQRLGLVAIDELELLRPLKVRLPSGTDPRLQKLINHMVTHPEISYSLPQLAQWVGASVRTIERLFKAETGTTFRQWRSRFRLLNSLDKISQGESSTAVAHALGYKSVSSFIAAFKQQFGCSPQEYTHQLNHE